MQIHKHISYLNSLDAQGGKVFCHFSTFQLQSIQFQQGICLLQAEQLDTDGFRTVEEVEKYAENTASSLYYLMLECLGKACLLPLVTNFSI